jgi:hypothetical protein
VVTPVTFPPGRLRLATKPIFTGSDELLKIIGIDVVTDFAANAAAGLPAAKMSDTCRLAKSAASAGSRSI